VKPISLMKTMALLAMAALAGCAQQSYVMLADNGGGLGGVVLGDDGERRLDASGQGIAIAAGPAFRRVGCAAQGGF